MGNMETAHATIDSTDPSVESITTRPASFAVVRKKLISARRELLTIMAGFNDDEMSNHDDRFSSEIAAIDRLIGRLQGY